MAGTLDQDAVEYLRNSGLDINSTNLNWAMDRLATTPGLRPSLRRQYSTRTEDKIAMNGGISPDDVLGPWDMSAFDPVAAANPNTPSSPRSNKNIGGPKAKAPSNPPMPMAKPATARPTDPNDPASYGDKWWTPENMQRARQGQAEAQYGPGAEVVPGGIYVPGAGAQPAPSNPMQNQAVAGDAAPAPQDKGMLDWLFGNGPTVNDVTGGTIPPPDPATVDKLIQGAAGGAMAIGNGGRAAAGLVPPSAARPPIPPGPPMGNAPPPAPIAPKSGGGAAAKPTPSAPKGGAQAKPANPNDNFTFGGAPAANEYRVPPSGKPVSMDEAAAAAKQYGVSPKPAPAATPKPANPPKTPSKGEAAADRMMKNSEPRANAKPEASSKSRMKDMTNKKEADAAEKARMDKMKNQGRAKRSYDQQRKSK